MFKVNKKAPVSNISRTIRFTEDIFDSLMKISGKEDVSFNQLVLQCCQYAIDNYWEGNEEHNKE